MANISLDDPNFVYVNNYFYTIDDNLNLLLKKTFDGEIAFCYTLDTPVEGEVVSLDYDGVYFWSLERGTSRVVIRRWKIEDLICIHQRKYDIITTTSEIIDGYAFAVEHYATKLMASAGGGADGDPGGSLTLQIEDASKLRNDLRIVVGPNTNGQSEEKIVDSFTTASAPDEVTLKTQLIYTYSQNDLIRFYKDGYYFNNFDGISSSKGSLHKIDLESELREKTPGTQFQNVKAAAIGQVKNKDGDGTYDFDENGVINSDDVILCLVFIKGPLMFFSDISLSEHGVNGSMLVFKQAPETVYDLTFGRNVEDPSPLDPINNGSTIYMLKKTGSTYDYQVIQFDRMVNSISVSSAPAILPADGISSSYIKASVLDQYGKGYPYKQVYFTLSPNEGSLSTGSAQTNADGVAQVLYQSGLTVVDVTITATVHQN